MEQGFVVLVRQQRMPISKRKRTKVENKNYYFLIWNLNFFLIFTDSLCKKNVSYQFEHFELISFSFSQRMIELWVFIGKNWSIYTQKLSSNSWQCTFLIWSLVVVVNKNWLIESIIMCQLNHKNKSIFFTENRFNWHRNYQIRPVLTWKRKKFHWSC